MNSPFSSVSGLDSPPSSLVMFPIMQSCVGKIGCALLNREWYGNETLSTLTDRMNQLQ